MAAVRKTGFGIFDTDSSDRSTLSGIVLSIVNAHSSCLGILCEVLLLCTRMHVRLVAPELLLYFEHILSYSSQEYSSALL